MATVTEVQEILAQDKKLQRVREKIRKAEGVLEGTSSAYQMLNSLSSGTAVQLSDLRAELAALEAGAIAGVTDDFRPVSTVDNASLAERDAGQIAVITLVKTNPATTQDEAIAAWIAAALAARPADRQWLLHDPVGLLKEYEANLGLTTWEEFSAWVVATPVEQMGI